MSKNLVITILLSTIILYVGMYIQQRYFTPPPLPDTSSTTVTSPQEKDIHIIPIATEQPLPEKSIQMSTNKFDITLSTKNASVTSFQIKNETGTSETHVELIPLGDSHTTFTLTLGSDDTALKDDVLFDYVAYPQEKKVEFFRDFIHQENGQEFTLKKTYQFKDDEYLFEIIVLLQNKKNEILRLGDTTYTLYFGPQLGPVEEVLSSQKSRQISQRKFISFDGKKRRNINVRKNNVVEHDTLYQWVGISGRYFSLFLVPGNGKYTSIFSTTPQEQLASTAQITLERNTIQSAAIEDVHRIYIGPHTKNQLKKYNNAQDNAFKVSGLSLDKSIPSRLLGFLERIWLAILRISYSIIPNYGVAIIMLTLLIRLSTYPILRKSKTNGEKMKLLAPKLQEIKEKYPNDNMKQSQEIMALYKNYGFSPLSSFLPLLLQLPIFLSMYRVISESFEFFKAPFFGWIDDLSSPDALLSFGDFKIPILGWTEFHILPIIMLLTQYVSSYIMLKQQRGQNVGSQKIMFILSYVFPFIIFFALYNSPSGLILYWITSNFVTIISIFDNNTKQVTLSPVKKKENPWKKYLRQGQNARR